MVLLALNILGLILGGQIEAAPGEGIQILKGCALLLPVLEVLRRDPVAIVLNLRPDHDQLIGLGIRHGRKQRGIDHGEDGGVGADAEGQRKHSCDGEARRLAQLPQRVAQILKNRLHRLAPLS